MNPYRHFGRTLWMGDLPIVRLQPAQDNTTQRDVDIHASMPRAGFETMIPVFGPAPFKNFCHLKFMIMHSAYIGCTVT